MSDITPSLPPAAADPTAPRRDVLGEIAVAPHRWDYYTAMRHLEAQWPGKPRLGMARRPADEPFRLGQSADLGFAASSLAGVKPATAGGLPRLQVRFFGLLGPNGPLPLHLTAYARERVQHRGDETFVRFADLFHHRLLLLFYRAWAQAQPTVSLDRPDEDRFADHVGSLIGMGGAAWRGRDAAPDHARLGNAGLLARQVRHADGLAAVLSRYLGQPVRVEQFAGRWMRLAQAERSRLARASVVRRRQAAQLGVNAVLGQAVFDRQHHIRIHIGPLDRTAFESLLPVGSALPAVQALIDSYVGLELGWDLQLSIRPAAVEPARLGGGARLGWSAWLPATRRQTAPEMTLVPRPSGAAATRTVNFQN